MTNPHPDSARMAELASPACRGDCHQGRKPCPHPSVCKLGPARITFSTPAGGHLDVEPSPTRGYVWLTHRHPDGPRPIVAIPLHLAGDVARAIEATATLLEEACAPPELPQHALVPAWPLKPCQDMGSPRQRVVSE